MVRARIYVLQKVFDGLPSENDFKIIEEELPPLKNGEFLAEAVYLTVDPYMRIRATEEDIGKPFGGEQVAKIVESKNPKYPVGKYVVGAFGWRTYTNADEISRHSRFPPPRLLPDIGTLPKSLGLGVLGMPGHSAYFGFLERCKPDKEGATIVITGAGGAVGHHVGQIAKIFGHRAVGITGSDTKGKWLTEELGFDAYINYKNPNFMKELETATPNGIDCFFDNVGGDLSVIILNRLNRPAKVCICGAISLYNTDPQKVLDIVYSLTGETNDGITTDAIKVFDYVDRWDEALQQNLRWLREGKLKTKETVTIGFETAVDAFRGLFEGKNTGKAIVQI